MKEDETIIEFNVPHIDISNNSFSLGEKMLEENMVRKILRSLPKSFDMKFIAIEEAQDVGEIKINELIGSLLSVEMEINDK